MRITRYSKRIVTFLVTLIILLGMAMPTAATGLDASQPDEGTITVHKYERNTQPTAHPDNIFSGEKLGTAITSTLGTPLMGAGFTLFRLDMTAVEAVLALDSTDSITGYTVDESLAPVYNVTFSFMTAMNVTVTATPPADIVNAATGLADGLGVEEFTDINGNITWGNETLLDGSYLLVETTVPAGYTKAASCVIRTPLTLNDGSDANRDVHVYPKNINESAIVNKEVDAVTLTPVNTDDIVPFKITTLFKNGLNKNIPAEAPNAVESVNDLRAGDGTPGDPYLYGGFKVLDTLEAYFNFTDTAVVAGTPFGALAGGRDLDVYLAAANGIRIGGVNALVAGIDYTISGITAGTYGQIGTIEIELTNAGIDKAIAGLAESLVLTFDVHYVGGATAADGTTATTIKNAAAAEMYPHGGTTPEIPEGEVYLPKAAIQINKVDEEGAPFADAEFALARVVAPTISFSEADWAADNYSVAQKTTLLTEYVCDTSGKPITAITDAAGNIIFDNVPYSDSGATYFLKELSTQSGYELPVSTIRIYLPSKAQIQTDLAYATYSGLLDSSGNWLEGALLRVTTEVENFPQGTSQDFSLPLTGGLGTIIFTLFGIILMGTAVALYLNSRKRNSKE